MPIEAATPRARGDASARLRLLISLEMAALGSSGIPQDTRLLFKALHAHTAHDVHGLLMENAGNRSRRIKPRRGAVRPEVDVLNASHYFLALSGFEPHRNIGRVERLMDRFEAFGRTYFRSQFPYRTRRVPGRLFESAAWRQLFQRSLPASDREMLGASPLHYTNLNFVDCANIILAPVTPMLRLDTKGFDVAVFPDARPISVSPGTRKFVRYHDAIPLTDPDLLGDGAYTSIHYGFLARSRFDSHFVCNSEATRANLLGLFPDLEPHASVIPCANDPYISQAARLIPPKEVVRSRLSLAALGEIKDGKVEVATARDGLAQQRGIPARDTVALRRSIMGRASLDQPWRYILAVTAIEPKKNVTTTVRAWERLRFTHDERLRLIIVGKSSWNTEASFTAMRPHVLSGDLFHLEDLPFVELQALYLNAEALVFPSYAEGFGYPPVEALTAGTPVVVSDIPALRSTLGEAAVYVNPYDVQSVASGLDRLVFGPDRAALGERIVALGRERIAHYALETIAPQWSEVLERTPPRARGDSRPAPPRP